MTHEDEKPGPALEDRFRERFAQGRHDYRRAVSSFDAQWTVPTDPDGIIPSLKTTPPPASQPSPPQVTTSGAPADVRILLFLLIALLLFILVYILVPNIRPSKSCEAPPSRPEHVSIDS